MYEINNLTFRYMLSDRNSLEQVSLKIKRKAHSDRRAKRQWKDDDVKTFKKRTAAQR